MKNIFYLKKLKHLKKSIRKFFKLDHSRDLIELPEDLYQAHVVMWGVPESYVFWIYDMNYHNDSVSSWFPQFCFGSEKHWYKSS